MLSDSMVQKKGYEALLKELGDIDIDRFISMAIKEPQDYTEWRSKNLNQDIAPEEFSKQAMDYVINEGLV